jgi:hypothetical protein
MDAYTTMGHACIQQRDTDAVLHADAYLIGASLAVPERQRGWQAEADMVRLLRQHGLQSASVASRLSMLRQTVGRALVRVGHRLATADPGNASPARAVADGKLRPAG